MSRLIPLKFQQEQDDALLERFREVRHQFEALHGERSAADAKVVRENGGVLLQAPTGIGKTLLACELLARFSQEEQVLWFWFAPFTGVLSQARSALKTQAPS